MSEKTQKLVPKFYLVNHAHTLCITQTMVLGRSKGDFILEDEQLSATHCEFIPRIMNLYVRDLNSTNGVFINKHKIFPNTEVKLEAGDKIILGSSEFTFYDNEMAANNAQSKFKDDSSGHHHGVITFANIFSFFRVPVQWKVLYTLVIFGVITSLVMNLRFESPLPNELNFLSQLYADSVVFNGIRLIFSVFVLCLVHAYFVGVILKSNYNKLISALVFLGVLFFMVDFVDGPVSYIKKYVQNRDYIIKDQPDLAAIVQLKNLTAYEKDLISAYKKVEKKISQEDREVLKKDFEKTLKIVGTKKAKFI